MGTSTPPPGATAPVVVSLSMSDKWLSTIQPLVAMSKSSAEDVTKVILTAKLVEAPDDDGATVLSDVDCISDDDFAKMFSSVAKGTLKKAVKELRKSSATPITVTVAPTPPIPTGAPILGTMFVIPDVPDGTDFLAALSASKTLTVDTLTIRAALEALFADDLKLSDIPEALSDAMEAHADTVEEPVTEDFMDVLKFVRERKYAEVNVDSRLVTKARKAETLRRLRELPVAVYQFHMALTAWNDELKSNRSSNPFGVLQGVQNLYPAADNVIGSSETVVACLKKAFSGLGVQVAKAMAYEGMKIRDILNDPKLPALTGSPTKELMLKRLGCEITNADVRQEKNIARYVIFAATAVPRDLPGGQEGPVLESLYNLGQQIMPWMNGNRTGAIANNGGNGRKRIPAPSDDPHPIGGDKRRSPNDTAAGETYGTKRSGSGY